MTRLAFGLNRFDFRSPAAFAADVRRAESLGWDAALVPSSPLLLQDPYVLLSFAALETTRIRLGTLIENPVMRHPAVLASSVATLDALCGGRALLGYGVGDTAVRLVGESPATVARLERATELIRKLLKGQAVELGARRPARLRHAREVPVWIASGGPRTLHMAGKVADGVFLRVGRHPANLSQAVAAVRDGAREAGRDPQDVRLGAVFHTVLTDDSERIASIGRSIAAGYYEISPELFAAPALSWDGPPVDELKREVWPDFHHAPDLFAAGKQVAFLAGEAVDAFTLHGSPEQVARQLREVLALGFPFEIIVPHPVPVHPHGTPSSGPDYMETFAREVMPRM